MTNFKNILHEIPNLKKITLKNNTCIICSDEDKLVIKEKNPKLNDLYNYLLSRSFDYFPSKIRNSKNYDIYEYIRDSHEPIEQKAQDLMKIIALLHNKTTYYKPIDLEDYKIIYEDILEKINLLRNYYQQIITNIDKEIYMSPSSYLFARNYGKLLQCLIYAEDEVNKWYQVIKNKKQVRLVQIHNNLSMDHYLKSDKPYLLSWDKSKKDMPIYDLLLFYQKYYRDFDFSELLKIYEGSYPLLKEEKQLLFVFMAIPPKIEFIPNQFLNCQTISNFFDYIYLTESLVTENSIKSQN